MNRPYSRAGSPRWRISYWSATEMKRVHETTAWRTDDPTGLKLATRYLAAKEAAAAAFRGSAKLEVWHAWVDKFLTDRYRAVPKTLKRCRNAWDWIRVYLDEKTLNLPAAVSYNHVLAYLDWRTQMKRHCGKLISRNTALTEVKVWGLIMREAIHRGFATINPCEKLGLKRDPAKVKPEMTAEEIATIRTALRTREGDNPIGERWMTNSFEIALHQGCRLAETQLKLSAISTEAMTIQFVGKGRNGKPNIFTTALNPGLLPLVHELRAAHAEATCRHPAMPSKAWHDFFKALDLGHLCFHCTRVTVITRLARTGVPIQQAMRFVGHASESVHEIYQRLKSEDLSRCTQALVF